MLRISSILVIRTWIFNQWNPHCQKVAFSGTLLKVCSQGLPTMVSASFSRKSNVKKQFSPVDSWCYIDKALAGGTWFFGIHFSWKRSRDQWKRNTELCFSTKIVYILIFYRLNVFLTCNNIILTEYCKVPWTISEFNDLIKITIITSVIMKSKIPLYSSDSKQFEISWGLMVT